MSLTRSLVVISENVHTRAILPPWVWGNASERQVLACSGIAGSGWLGKTIQDVAIAYSELRVGI